MITHAQIAKPESRVARGLTPAPGLLLQRKCACGGTPGQSGECEECRKKRAAGQQRGYLGIQTKLAIGASNDPLEQEADRVAEQVLAAPAHPPFSAAARHIQRHSGQPVGQSGAAPVSVDRVLASSGRPLDPTLEQEMGQRFGYDFSRVRVHSGAEAEESAREVNANAYTVGHNIVFGSGQFAPETQGGRRLLAHELAHVVQQSGADGIPFGPSNGKRGLSSGSSAHRNTAVPAGYMSELAYTQGHDIVSARGTYDPTAEAGRRHVAHEFVHTVQQEEAGPMVQRKDADPKAEAEAQRALGERLWKDFPQGVNVAFYQESNDEAKRRAVDWAAREHALGLKNSKLTASNLVFDKAVSDSHDLGSTLAGISSVLKAATATPPAGTTPTAGMGPEKVRALAIFSHGTSDWCGLGSITTGNAAAKAKAIAPALATNVNVLLFTCNAARGQSENEEWVKGTMEGGGADSLAGVIRDALLAEGIQYSTVWGHTTTGHVSENFALREFFGASGKGAAGYSYVSTFIFTGKERDAAVVDLQMAVTAKGYAIDDPTKFVASANAALTNVMYFCYADAHSKIPVDGAKLGEAAPMHPHEVADVVKQHWRDTYCPGKKDKTADALIKSLKLKKSAPASK
jgi:hypothetical protein